MMVVRIYQAMINLSFVVVLSKTAVRKFIALIVVTLIPTFDLLTSVLES